MTQDMHMREAAGALLRSCVSAAGPELCPGLAGSQLAFGSNSKPASLRDRPGHGSGLLRRLRAISLRRAPAVSLITRATAIDRHGSGRGAGNRENS